jgi:RHS repeat-associated protein
MGFYLTQPISGTAAGSRPADPPTCTPHSLRRSPLAAGNLKGGPTSSRILSSKYRDRESHLYCFGFRYYASHTGRWISRDPVGESGSPGLYAYTMNLPVSQSDFLGQYIIGVDLRHTHLHGSAEAYHTPTNWRFWNQIVADHDPMQQWWQSSSEYWGSVAIWHRLVTVPGGSGTILYGTAEVWFEGWSDPSRWDHVAMSADEGLELTVKACCEAVRVYWDVEATVNWTSPPQEDGDLVGGRVAPSGASAGTNLHRAPERGLMRVAVSGMFEVPVCTTTLEARLNMWAFAAWNDGGNFTPGAAEPGYRAKSRARATFGCRP